jgi:hypothetical protein
MNLSIKKVAGLLFLIVIILVFGAWFFRGVSYTQPWTEMNASAGWPARSGHNSVAMPDGSILLMGGADDLVFMNDVWRSRDKGSTWTLVNASAGWPARYSHSSVVLPGGSIVLTGGYGYGGYKNDTWRSTDNGATWTLVNASSGWTARDAHTLVAMPDGSIVLSGGRGSWDNRKLNDTWRSTDNGATWILMNASSGWRARAYLTSVLMPDRSILLMGGLSGSGSGIIENDVWRSKDSGTTWILVNSSSWVSGRSYHSSVVMPDGSILLMGGAGGGWFPNLWQSTDSGATWTLINTNPGWSARGFSSSLVLPDGSIVLIGGDTFDGSKNDTWRLVPSGLIPASFSPFSS